MRILLVCTGNTCRSPMAEALLRRALAERGVTGVEVASAGTGAWTGSPASEGSYLVGLERGLDLSAHRARVLDPALLAAADLVLVMGRTHLARVQALGAGDKAHLLGEYAGLEGDAAEVSDPFGAGLDEYRTTFDELDRLLARVADRLVGQQSGDHR